MRVSVAMAVYNGLPYLAEQLDSLLAQSVPPDQVVVSDDHSTDGSWELLQGYAARWPGSRLLLTRNPGKRGYNPNFAHAFGLCDGDIVFPCDQDDVWKPAKIETMRRFLAADPAAMVAIHDMDVCDAALAPVGQRKIERAYGVHGPLRDYNAGMASAIRGDFLRLCLPVPARFGYDNWIHFAALALGAKRLVSESLALYRRHGANATQSAPLQTAHRKSAILIRIDHVLNALRADREGRDVASDILKHAALRDWLSERQAALSATALGPERVRSALDEATAQVALAETRLAIRRASPIVRLWRVAALVARGDYRRASGLRSALKDLLMG